VEYATLPVKHGDYSTNVFGKEYGEAIQTDHVDRSSTYESEPYYQPKMIGSRIVSRKSKLA